MAQPEAKYNFSSDSFDDKMIYMDMSIMICATGHRWLSLNAPGSDFGYFMLENGILVFKHLKSFATSLIIRQRGKQQTSKQHATPAGTFHSFDFRLVFDKLPVSQMPFSHHRFGPTVRGSKSTN